MLLENLDPEAPSPTLLLGYVIGAILFIVFVCFRVSNRGAVARGGFGATNTSANVASFLLFFLILAGLAWVFGGK